MNALFKGIYNHFSATTGSGFYNDVSGRMYLYKAPQQSVFPYCVYFPVTDLSDVDFTDERHDMLVQFNIFSQKNSSEQAGDLLDSLENMFDDCSLTVTGWRHLQFFRTMTLPNNDFDDDPVTHGYSVEYSVLLEKERS